MKTAIRSLSLFPDSPHRLEVLSRRRASRRARGEKVAETRGAQYRPLACSTLLNRKPNRSLPFHWSINPYRGCGFGCPFCYARTLPIAFDPADPYRFSSRIYVKFQAGQLLCETVTPKMLRGRPIAIGTATDPYQPAEKRFRITRRILEVLSRAPDLNLTITTRSPLIVRDIDLLRRIARSAWSVCTVRRGGRSGRSWSGTSPTCCRSTLGWRRTGGGSPGRSTGPCGRPFGP